MLQQSETRTLGAEAQGCQAVGSTLHPEPRCHLTPLLKGSLWWLCGVCTGGLHHAGGDLIPSYLGFRQYSLKLT